LTRTLHRIQLKVIPRADFRVFVFTLLFNFSFAGYSQLSITANSEVNNPFGNNLPEDTIKRLATPDRGLANTDDAPMFDEVLVTLNIQRIGGYEMSAIISGEVVYLSTKELFDILRIRNVSSADLDSLQVFFTFPKTSYIIDKAHYQIVGQDKVFKLKPTDIVQTETGLYLKSDFFALVFGLECSFNFRSLSVTLNTKIELPALREMQQELMRKNISQLKGEKKADTTIRQGFTWFKVGAADWAVVASQETGGSSQTQLNLGIGAVIAGGEANLFLNHNTRQPFDLQKQNYYWRHVDNDNKVLRQITAGKIIAQSTSSIFDQVTGVQFTNTPTTYRRSFGTYTLSDRTEPGWTVELYINNVLLNYTKADASGFFTFEVPMVYGNSVVKLRFFGPWGEEKIREQYITVPFSFIPAGQLEYTVTAGVVDDAKKSKYSRVNVNYGASKRITVGGGFEYLSSVSSGKGMPFINASLRLGSNMMLSGEHTYGVRSKAIANFRLPSDLQVNLSYIKYDRDQKAVWVNQLDEKKAIISMPFRGRKISAFSRLTMSQVTYSKLSKFTNAELMFSAIVSNISANITTSAVKRMTGKAFVHSNLSSTFRLPAGIRFTPQIEYEFNQKSISLIKGEVEMNMLKQGFLNLSFEQYKNKECGVGIGFRYNFSFAQTSFFARRNKQSMSTTESARGSLIYNGKTNYLGSTNQNSVGRGGLIVVPFLDVNCNGVRDQGEGKVSQLQLSINGGRIEHNYSDTTIRITGLEAYTSYVIEVDKNSFDNIGWKVQKPLIKVAVEPNNLKIIEIPVSVLGEVSGTVYLKDTKGMNGLGRIIINIYSRNLVVVAKVLSESDGYFSFLGLTPGLYTARVDPAQLIKLKMTSSTTLPCVINPSLEGAVVDGLQFVLSKTQSK